jgi:hypothetical protein
MKTFINILLVGLIALTLLGFGLLSLSMVNAAGQELPSLIQLMPETSSYKLIDDFDSGASRPCYVDNGAVISAPCPIINGYAVMTYDVTKKTNPAQPSYAWLPNNIVNKDLSVWDSVWIIIEGKKGGEKLYAEFTECYNPTFQKIEINDYIFGGITNTWRAAAIPFSEFDQVQDWSCIERFSIIAHSDISGKGEVHVNDIRLLPSKVIIDDFDDLVLFKNELGGVAGTWCDPNVPSCVPIITPTLVNGNLKLNYDLTPPNIIGAGYWTKLLSTQLFSYKDNLFLDVRSEQGDKKIWVELKDCNDIHTPEIQINDYLEIGLTTNWQTVVIPLAAFVDIAPDNTRVNWDCIDQLTLNLRGMNSGVESGQGTIYFDNIRLTPVSSQTGRVPVIVDHFNDCDRWNALSWPWQIGAELTLTATPVSSTNQSGNYGCSYRLAYAVTLAQSGYTWAELRGLDLTGYDYLQFFVKGKTGSEIMNVCLRDRTQTEDCNLLPILATDTWRRVMMPLSQFNSPNVNLTDLENLKFAFDNRIETSEVYIDSISFIQLQRTALPIISKAALTELYVFNDDTGGDLTFVVRDLMDKGEITSCVVPNNATLLCGRFPPGRYEVQAFTICSGDSNPIAIRNYHSGPQTQPVYCASGG